MALIYHDEDTVQQLAEEQPELAGCQYVAAVSDGIREPARPGISVSSCLKPVKSWG